MYLGNKKHFKCNGDNCKPCEIHVSVLPSTWAYSMPKMGDTRHYCEHCIPNVPSSIELFRPGTRNKLKRK